MRRNRSCNSTRKKLRSGLISLCKFCELPVVSLDRAYLNDETNQNIVGFLDINRAVDEKLRDIGLVCRPNSPDIKTQINLLENLLNKTGTKRIALVDDVIFSGKGIINIINLLKERGILVEKVIAGIMIGNGLEKLKHEGISTLWLELCPEVVDEVCERDFLAGVPLSGRIILDGDGKLYSAPYFYPFGNPVEWASIPEKTAEDFSQFCVEQSTLLWGKIEKINNSTIPLKAIPRKLKIQGITEEVSIVKALEKLKKS